MKRIFSKFKSEYFIYLGLAALFIYLAIPVLKDWSSQPIHNAYIKDGHTVDFETESKLSDIALSKAAEKEKTEQNTQAIKTLYFCLSTAKDINNYDCIGNLFANSIIAEFPVIVTNVGENIYLNIVSSNVLTGLEKEVLTESAVYSEYKLSFLFLDGTKSHYWVTVEKGKITHWERLV